MNRRQYLSIVGTTGVGAAALFVGYQVQQGNIELGGSSVVTEEVYEEDTFTFDVTADDEIFITLSERNENGVSARFKLSDPDGNEVKERRLQSSIEEINERHTAEQTGTYRLSVGAGKRERVYVSVSVTDPEE